MRCGQAIPAKTKWSTHEVEVEVLSIYKGSAGVEHGWAYQVTFRNKSKKTVQMLTRHWVFVDEKRTVNEVKGPGARGVTPVLIPGGSWAYESGTSLRTARGSFYGSFQFEVLDAAPGELESFSARVARTALSPEDKSENVPCAREADRDKLPATSVASTSRVIVGATSRFKHERDGKFEFLWDVQINNARSDAIMVLGYHIEVVDSSGNRAVAVANKKVKKSVDAGDAFRLQGVIGSPTSVANIDGYFDVRLSSGEDIRAQLAILGCSRVGSPVGHYEVLRLLREDQDPD